MGFDINKVIKIAEAEVGYLEKKSNKDLYSKTGNAGQNNYTKYAYEFDTKYTDFYNGKKNGYAWCDMFVDWCFIKAYGEANALKLLGQPKKSCGAGCQYSANYFKKINRFYTSPKKGDQIFFKNSSGEVCHTGLVYKVDNTYVYTIEGNTSSATGVIANGGCVTKKKYTLKYSRIYGYGRPNYGTQPSSSTSKPSNISKPFSKFTGYVTANVLNVRKGAGTKYYVLGTLKKGTSVNVVGESGDWYKISYKGSTAYVSKQYISKTKTSASATSKPKTYKVKVTAKSGLNIRKSASLISSKVGVLAYGTIVEISKASGKWGYIPKYKGWVYLSYTKKV